MAIKIDDAVAGYIKLRDQLEELKKGHKETEAVLRVKMDQLEAYFLSFLNTTGGSSFQAKGIGTVFRQDVVSCTVRDWDATLGWVRDGGHWEFLERRVSKQVVQDYAASTQQLPPGVDMTTTIEVRIRRS